MSTPEPTAPVTMTEGRLRVTDWETRDPDILRYFEVHGPGQDGDENLAVLLERVLKVGVLAVGAAGVSANVDYVEKEFQRLATQIETEWETRVGSIRAALDTIFAEETGVLPRALKTYLGEGGHLEELFDPNRRDSALGRVQDLMREHLGGEGSTLYCLLDLTHAGSPLQKWRDELHRRFEELRQLLETYRTEVREQLATEKGRAEMLEKTAIKGRAYEDLVFEAVNEIARHFGDGAEATGDQPGLGGSKVGDVVVTLSTRDTQGVVVRLVFEAKDKAVGLTPILRELDEAHQNRDAVAAIAVYSRGDGMPTGTAPFQEQGRGQFLCLYDKEAPDDRLALQLAYRVARYWALADLRREARVVDTQGIAEDLEAARARLKATATLKGRLTRVRESVDEGLEGLERDLADLATELSKIFARIDERLQSV